MHKALCWGYLKGPFVRWEDNIKWILKKWDGTVNTGSIRLRIGISRAVVSTVMNHKIHEIFRLPQELPALQDGLCYSYSHPSIFSAHQNSVLGFDAEQQSAMCCSNWHTTLLRLCTLLLLLLLSS